MRPPISYTGLLLSLLSFDLGCATVEAPSRPPVDPQLQARIKTAGQQLELAAKGPGGFDSQPALLASTKLALLLSEPRSRVDVRTAKLLVNAKLDDPRAAPTLIRELDAPRASRRWSALAFIRAHVLRRRLPGRKVQTTEALARRIVRMSTTDADPKVRLKALETLRVLPSAKSCSLMPFLSEHWRGDDPLLAAAASRIAISIPGCGDVWKKSRENALLRRLASESPTTREAAATVLCRPNGCGEVGHQAREEAALQLLSSKKQELRRAVANILYRLAAPSAPKASAWVARFRDAKDLYITRRLAWHMLKRPDSAVGQEVFNASSQRSDAKTRHALVAALVARKDPRIELMLIGRLNASAGRSIDLRAVEGLAALKSAKAVEPLIALLPKNPDMDVIEALGMIGDTRCLPALRAAVFNRRATIYELVEATKWLSKLDPDGSLDYLVGQLNVRSARTRGTAAKALGYLGDPRAIEALIARKDDSSPRVRAMVLRALGDLGRSDRVVKILTDALSDPSTKVAYWAATALAKVKHPASAPALSRAVRDSRFDVASAAIDALGELDTMKAWLALRDAAPDHPTLKQYAADNVRFVVERWPAAYRAAIQSLTHSDPRIRALAVNSVFRDVRPGDLREVGRRLSDPDERVRQAASRTLTAQRTVEAFGLLAAAQARRRLR